MKRVREDLGVARVLFSVLALAVPTTVDPVFSPRSSFSERGESLVLLMLPLVHCHVLLLS